MVFIDKIVILVQFLIGNPFVFSISAVERQDCAQYAQSWEQLPLRALVRIWMLT